MEKIEQTIRMRASNKEEGSLLGLGLDEQVLEMTRWLYETGNDVSISYLYFVTPCDLFGCLMRCSDGAGRQNPPDKRG